MAKRQPLWRREEYEQKERRQREAVIAQFDAGDTGATLHAMAAETLRYWHAGMSASTTY